MKNCPDSMVAVKIRGPVEPGLVSPASDLAILYWLRNPKVDKATIPMVEPHMMSSILGALEKWSIIPATYILVEGKYDGVYSVQEAPGQCGTLARKMPASHHGSELVNNFDDKSFSAPPPRSDTYVTRLHTDITLRMVTHSVKPVVKAKTKERPSDRGISGIILYYMDSPLFFIARIDRRSQGSQRRLIMHATKPLRGMIQLSPTNSRTRSD